MGKLIKASRSSASYLCTHDAFLYGGVLEVIIGHEQNKVFYLRGMWFLNEGFSWQNKGVMGAESNKVNISTF